MSTILTIIKELQGILDIYFFLPVIAIGLFTLLLDYKNLKDMDLKKDASIAKFISIFYIIGGPVVYIILLVI